MGVKSGWMFWMSSAWILVLGCAHQERTRTGAERKVDAEGIVLKSANDLDVLRKKVQRYTPTRIAFDPSPFNERQIVAIGSLIDASRVMDDLFWEQASPHGPEIRKLLANPRNEEERLLELYLRINYGAYDRLDEFEPFIEASDPDLVAPKPPGATFYPVDMTRAEWERHLADHPGDREAFQSNFTVMRRKEGKLVAIPYSLHYAEKLTRASELLKKAAYMIVSPSLAKYLNSRADALLSNDYFESDMDWMDVTDSALEVTIGPYEVYEDRLFNFKAAFESFVTVRDKAESEKLAKVGGYLTEMEKNLPIPDEHKNLERGSSSPVVVADLIYSAGDTRAGVQTLAFNLPNDERVRESKGSKKVLLKNISHAKFDKILVPIARRVLAKDQLDRISFNAYFNHTLMHEVSHGLGPGFIVKDGKRTTVNRLLKDLYSTIEEAKADVLGMYNTLFLVRKGVLPKSLQQQGLVTFLAGAFRSVRFGVHEAHGRANAIAFNYLHESGAYRYDAGKKRFSVDLTKAPDAVRELASKLLMVQALGDYDGAKALIDEYGHIEPEMQGLLDSLGDIPVDIMPIFEVE